MCLEGMDSEIGGLDMAHHQFQHQRHLLQQQQQTMLSFSAHNTNRPSVRPNQQQQQQSIQSDEDETEEAKNRASPPPWQRMKWTDSMVRLLIMVVFYIEDDFSHSRAADPLPLPNKSKKSIVGSSPSNVQKKGKKWKSVSRAMMEKGFFVSPQQCEDKFNDLNKRYKRVNEILGRGMSCRVVENQTLLDSMDNLSSKSKDEVRKLLNSKHLFYREMCAYHNTGFANAEQLRTHQQHHHRHIAQFSENLRTGSNSDGEDEDDDDESDEDEDEAELEEQSTEAGEGEKKQSVKKRRRLDAISEEELRDEMVGVLGNGGRSECEKREWVVKTMVRLEEERVRRGVEGLQMERERARWVKFCGRKEREMGRLKMMNERIKVENARMVVLIRRKEIELFNLQYHQQQQLQQQSSSNNNNNDVSAKNPS